MTEKERKYLLKEIPDLTGYEFRDISQGYLSYEPEIRIRKKENEFLLTKKSNGDLERDEIEVHIQKEAFMILSNMIVSNLIRKLRFFIPLDNDHIAELDVYFDNLENLYTVEVEFDTIEDANNFIKPDWFGEEVTYDKRYKNKNLAKITKEEFNLLVEKEEHTLQLRKNYRK